MTINDTLRLASWSEIRCTLNVGGRCGQQALELLLVQADGDQWMAAPRCSSHPAADWLPVIRRIYPHAAVAIVPLVLDHDDLDAAIAADEDAAIAAQLDDDPDHPSLVDWPL